MVGVSGLIGRPHVGILPEKNLPAKLGSINI